MEYALSYIENKEIKKSNLQQFFNFNEDSLKNEHFVFITAHDDDPIIGAGVLLKLLTHYKIPVSIVITSDGCMGYQSEKHKGDAIIKERVSETYRAYDVLGVSRENIVFLNYPDSNLHKYLGRKKASILDYLSTKRKYIKKGHIGLLNSMVYYLRKYRATKVFIHTKNDYHPDHKLVFDQCYWSNFFSASNYWPDLGKGFQKVPDLYEYFVYASLSSEPDFQIDSFEASKYRLDSIKQYKSQGEIHGIVNELKESESFDWFCKLKYEKADKSKLKSFFSN